MRFPSRGTYLHGDYSLRNIMIVSSLRLRAVIFDPNPLIGDPSWDVAVLFNNRDFRRRRYEWEPSNPEYRKGYRIEQRFFEGFLQSYRRAREEKLDLASVRISQLIHTIVSLQTEERKQYPRKKKEKELELRVRREALFERFGSLATSFVTTGEP
jgi:aminoglycoside phosphotransferase (APT) family kinase protein